jgi:hypothetical protein|tara:strand:- start:210 stop:416 length:207 start_codon:yes stop_codon:yes gene_type:complete
MSNWHSDYIRNCKKRSVDSLRYVIEDCRQAMIAMPDNPKAGQYQDEIIYCFAELKRREKFSQTQEGAA